MRVLNIYIPISINPYTHKPLYPYKQSQICYVGILCVHDYRMKQPRIKHNLAAIGSRIDLIKLQNKTLCGI